MSNTTDAFVHESQDRFLEELKSFLRIPSISTLPEHRADIDRAAGFVADSLRAAGLENVEIIPTAKHPLVYADWMHAPGKPTVLCYGHYDVQPPDPLDLWVSPPFEPTIRDGNLYARASADDKGQMYMHVKAVETLRAVNGGRLPAKHKSAAGVIRLPGIYHDVEAPAQAEKQSWETLPFREKQFLKKEVGSTQLTGESKYSVLERIWARPTFEVHGIAGGFTAAGAKTVIPAKATAKVSIRIVPKQDPEKEIGRASCRERVEKTVDEGG